MTIETITADEFAKLAPMVAANQELMRALPSGMPSGMPSGEFRAALPFPEIGNAETGKVEQYRIRQELPDSFGAYLSGDGKTVTVWTGEPLGYLIGRPNRSRCGRFVTFAFRMNGRDYHARGAGRGMYCGAKAYKGKSA